MGDLIGNSAIYLVGLIPLMLLVISKVRRKKFEKTNTIRYLTSVLLLFLLTGCWSSHEIEELGLTFAMGIDKGEETELEKV